jgi:CRISPR-associated protein Cst2
MTHHLFGAVLTPEGVASNNRGENAGNVSTLQKLLRRGETFTTVSAEAIRFALREYWTAEGNDLNRAVDGDGETTWKDASFKTWKEHLDDDVLGFMHPKEDTTKRRGRLELSRAISTRPWPGDVMFNVASPGSHPRDNKDPIPYAVEVHCTRYQYGFGLTPGALHDSKRALAAIDALQNVHRVAGNHARYFYQFAPDAIVLRWTHDPVPRFMYCFEEDEAGMVSAQKLLSALTSGDVDPAEVVVGGEPLVHLTDELEALGAKVYPGVKQAFSDMRNRVEAEV